MKVGLVGYQGCGKSTVFQLLTGIEPDLSKAHSGQVGVATIPDHRFDRLCDLYQPKKQTPAKIELLDTPGLSRDEHQANAQKLGVIREAHALVHIIGAYAGADVRAEAAAFIDDLVLADLQVVSNRVERLHRDVKKPRPDRDELKAELEALFPIAAKLEAGDTVQEMEFSESQQKATRSFALLTRKQRLIVLNTADADVEPAVANVLIGEGHAVVAAPFGLELELQDFPEDEQAEFAAEMGIGEASRDRLLRAIFEVTEQITFYTCETKEVHAWLLKRGATALEAADTIHSDIARGFIRAEIMSSNDLLRLGSERALKAAGLHHVEARDYVVQDGDEIFVRFNV